MVGELKVSIYRGREGTGIAQDETGVNVELSDGQSLRAEYLAGCDGGRSRVRKAAGIEFPGWDPTISNLIGEVELAEEPEWGLRRDDRGIRSLSKLENAEVRVLVTEPCLDRTGEPTLRDLSEALVAGYGTDYGVHSATSLSRYTDMARQAASYRKGRILLAGDSAHVHYPGWRTGPETRCSDGACRISTWSPPTARCGSSLCCTNRGRCCSISVSRAASRSLDAQIGFG